MGVLRWGLKTVALVALMVGTGWIVAFVLGAATLTGLAGGAAVSAIAVLGLIVADPPVPWVQRSRPEYPLADAALREFASELERMLDRVRPARLDRARSRLGGWTDTFVLAHDTRPDWDIEAIVGEIEIVVQTADEHEHFFADPDERAHVADALALIAQLLRGELEFGRERPDFGARG